MMTAPAPSGPAKRSKRLYVYWGVALTLLLAAGLLCWKVVMPYFKGEQDQSEAKPVPQWIVAQEAERLGKNAPAVKIDLRYLEYPEVVEHKSGRWNYTVSVLAPKGRSSVRAGMLVFEGKLVRNTEPDERISTPFGIMQFFDGKKYRYRQGWFPIPQR